MPQALQHSRPALAARQTLVEVVPQLAHICTVQHSSPHTTARGVGTAWRDMHVARRLQLHAPVRRCVSPERLTRCRLLVGSPAKRPLGSAHTLCGASGWPEAASNPATRASVSAVGTGIPCFCRRVTSVPSLSCSTTPSAHKLACYIIKQCTLTAARCRCHVGAAAVLETAEDAHRINPGRQCLQEGV